MPRFLPLACLLFLAAPPSVQAQELQCTVNVDFSQLQNTNVSDVAFLNDFGIEVGEYLNNQRWTNDRFEEVERIACSFVIAFTERPTQTTFRARLVVTSQRPIYGTRQSTSMLKVADEGWDFEYVQGQSLTRDPNRIDRLTALLDYYAYLILGYDYDSFAPLGGTPFFEQAFDIVTRAQGEAINGWTSFGADRTRSQIVQELTDPRYLPVRQAYYAVHRLGVDAFIDDPEIARTAVLAALRSFEDVADQAANPYVLDIFFDTKSVAIVGMLSRSSQSSEAYALLLTLDPTRSSAYGALVN